MVNRIISICAIVGLIQFSLSHQQLSHHYYSPHSSQILLSGRYYLQDNLVKYDWPCFRIEFCFLDSTKVTWNVIDTWNIYTIILDQKQKTTIQPKQSQNITIFKSSKPQSHCIQIVKITENHYGPIASHKDSIFKGIILQGGELRRKQQKYDYKFQFLGDSITTAFGVLSGRNPICFFRMKSIQSCLDCWAVHLSKMFKADYRLQAVSGKGVIRNMVGVPGPKMPTLFTRYSDNSAANSYKYEDHYIPDVLFSFIGENDYYYKIKNPSVSKFVEGYVDMLQRVAKDYMIYADSTPKIIAVCDIEYNRQLCANVRTAVNSFKYAYNMVYYVEIPVGTLSREYMGCIGHPNSIGQKRIAEAVYKEAIKVINHGK